MTKLLSATALTALALSIPAATLAQRVGPATVVVVDTNRIFTECTACRSAQTQLQTQLTALQTRAQTLETPLQTEGNAIATATRALNGKAPDAALQTRITAFNTRRNTAAQELQRSQQNLQSIQANVNQQISAKLTPIISAEMTARGGTLAVDKIATLAAAPALDITNEVLARLNRDLPSVSVTPLPQQAQQPAGR